MLGFRFLNSHNGVIFTFLTLFSSLLVVSLDCDLRIDTLFIKLGLTPEPINECSNLVSLILLSVVRHLDGFLPWYLWDMSIYNLALPALRIIPGFHHIIKANIRTFGPTIPTLWRSSCLSNNIPMWHLPHLIPYHLRRYSLPRTIPHEMRATRYDRINQVLARRGMIHSNIAIRDGYCGLDGLEGGLGRGGAIVLEELG